MKSSYLAAMIACCTTAAVAGCTGSVRSVEEARFADQTSVACISMQRIQATEVVDDRTILFLGLGGIAYVNRLETDCPTLKANGLFRYRIDSGILTARLCDSQSITVIDRTTNALTNNCRLGVFEPVTREEADVLLGLIPELPDGAVETIDLPVEASEEDRSLAE